MAYENRHEGIHPASFSSLRQKRLLTQQLTVKTEGRRLPVREVLTEQKNMVYENRREHLYLATSFSR